MMRWKQRPEGSTWGDFGESDQLGRLNLLTPEKVKQGVAEVIEGATFCLSLPLDCPGGNTLNPFRFPPVLHPTLRKGRDTVCYELRDDLPDVTDVYNDDAAVVFLQYSTQWDSLGHLGSLFDADESGALRPTFYNGFRGPENFSTAPGEKSAPSVAPLSQQITRIDALHVANMAEQGVQGRGVLVDLEAHFGSERQWIGFDELSHVIKVDGIEIERGDILCLHTGFARTVLEAHGRPSAELFGRVGGVLDGRDRSLLDWISDSEIACIAADNYAVEGLPSKPGVGTHAYLPLHEHCLFKLGVHLGELWYLSELARWLHDHRRNRFLLTAPPLRLPGAVGSPVTPIATV